MAATVVASPGASGSTIWRPACSQPTLENSFFGCCWSRNRVPLLHHPLDFKGAKRILLTAAAASSSSSSMERDSAAAAAADFFRTPAQSWRSQNIKRFEHLRRLELDNNTEKEIAVLNNLMSVGSEQQNHNGTILRTRPKRIILVRHGQSEGNIDESAYTRIPDSKIALTEVGWKQAVQCGKKIRHVIESDHEENWQVYFYVSPYRRTLQTLRGIGMAFERHRIAGVREEPRLREQDFGGYLPWPQGPQADR
jgi:hypothetical protein